MSSTFLDLKSKNARTSCFVGTASGDILKLFSLKIVRPRCWQGLFAILTLALLQGCFCVPLPPKVISGKEIQPEDVAFIEAGQTSNADIVQRLGTPDKVYNHPSVSVYWWLVRTGAWGLGTDHDDFAHTQLLLIQFDDAGLVRKFELRRAPRRTGVTHEFITNWSMEK